MIGPPETYGYMQVLVGPTSCGAPVQPWVSPYGDPLTPAPQVWPPIPWVQPVYPPDLTQIPLEDLLAEIRRRAGGAPTEVTTTITWTTAPMPDCNPPISYGGTD